MKIDIITLFPKFFTPFLKEGILKRAQEREVLKINIHNLRKWAKDKHKTVDDRPFGGGRGMILKIEPIWMATKELKKAETKILLFTPRGKKFNQKIATELSKFPHLILICGRYEGVDERVAKYIADYKISIGNFVLMGGEIPALVVLESVARLLPGVIGKSELLKERITKKGGFIEYPQYTRPEVFRPEKGINWRVPKILLSGNHQKIQEWRKRHSKVIE